GPLIPGAVEDGDRDAPRPLSRDAPVRTSLHHAADALPAPGWNPAALRVDLVDGRERRLADGGVATAREIDLDVEADPPLIGGAEDHRVLAAPAVRVAVADLPRPAPRVEQDSSAREQLGDLRVRVEHLETLESRDGDVSGEAAVPVHRRPDRQPVLHAHVDVVLAMARSGVDQTGAGVSRGMTRHHASALALDQRVAVLPAVPPGPL